MKGYLRWVEGWLRASPPAVPGMDVAGVVVATGASVSKFAVGDRVFGMMDFRRNGTLAEYVACNERLLTKIPGAFTSVRL